MANRFTLYGNQRSGPTYRVGLMLALCKAPHEYVHVDFQKADHKTPDYLAKNRFGQVPCLHDGQHYYCQSSSILQYLAEVLDQFDGKNAEEHARIREWMFWDFDRLAPGIFRSRAIKAGFRKAEPPTIEMYKQEGEAGLGVLNDWLGKHQWIVDARPTIADVDIYPVIHYAPAGGFDLGQYPNVAGWAKRMEALPGFGTPEQVLPKESRS